MHYCTEQNVEMMMRTLSAARTTEQDLPLSGNLSIRKKIVGTSYWKIVPFLHRSPPRVVHTTRRLAADTEESQGAGPEFNTSRSENSNDFSRRSNAPEKAATRGGQKRALSDSE